MREIILRAFVFVRAKSVGTSIFLHGGLNPAWNFWLSSRFSCCLKMKSVENLLGYIRGQFYRFLRLKIVQENTPKCSELNSFLGNKKWVETRIQAWCFRMFCGIFGWFFSHWNEAMIWKKYSVMKKIFCCPAQGLFCCIPLWKTVMLSSSRAF